MRQNRLVIVVSVLLALAIGFLAGRARITTEGEKAAEQQLTEERERREPTAYPGEPMPAVVYSVMPEYPEAARKEGLQGTVLVRVLVDTTGSVVEATVSRSVHPILDSAAVEAARNWMFKPAELRGRTAKQYVVIPVKFALE